jgi:hypothetical protein
MSQMVISSANKQFTFKDGYINRTLKCPANRLKQFNEDFYNFSKETFLKYGFRYFKMIDIEQKTHEDLARRLWASLWSEGWREKIL